ncbi:MAG TPA: glucose-6-phosphate dehydrogenase [Gammaproteobacteria bacterium]|nr:glucose-6-phosphate dehydrogenase [Gammaproteobacteria bacterium]
MDLMDGCSKPVGNESPTVLKPATPCVLVIFGITGDLAKRLLIPAICNLGSHGLLDEAFSIVGIGRKPFNTESLHAEMQKNLKDFVKNPEAIKFGQTLVNRISYVRGDITDANLFSDLKKQLEALASSQSSKNYLFYLAVPPDAVTDITIGLHQSGLLKEAENTFKRIIVEKPFGHDLASAKKLNQQLLTVLNEQQIYRIDHYLGKETVQNLMTFRFLNSIFDSVWNHHYIDHVEITVAEALGVESRGRFYEDAGALRDMVPNHLFQILSLLAMEPPLSLSSDPIRDEKIKLLRSIQMMSVEQVLERTVRGQYVTGIMDGKEVPGYLSEQDVSPQSTTETYVAMKLFIDNLRWLHVPFYLRTGKRLQERTSKIVIKFKSPSTTLFGKEIQNVCPNLLRINIQPQEGISLRIAAKIPGISLQVSQVDMNFKYCDYFGMNTQTGYEVLLYDSMNGDHTSFQTADMVETSWALVQPILDNWAGSNPAPLYTYAAGTWGPKAADELLRKDGRVWLA